MNNTNLSARSTTREQWHAERRLRGQRNRAERASAPYADFACNTHFAPPMPTGRTGPRLLNAERRAAVLRRVHDRKRAAAATARDARLLSLMATDYVLPTHPADLSCIREFLRWTKPGESDQDLIHSVARRMRLATAMRMAA